MTKVVKVNPKIRWYSVEDHPPKDGQRVLTMMKHGMIEGTYNAEDKTFHGYYWHNMEWWASHWTVLEDNDLG